ncbi:MAG: hypothetical protein ACXVKN_13980 [Acidimicrobiia bacterium]
MSLPAAVNSHHTAWVSALGATPHPVRYSVDGERLVCFGDDRLANVPDNTRVSVAIHEISGGHLVAQFGAALHRLAPGTVAMGPLVELLEHVPLGRTLEEVHLQLADQQAHRRIVELIP